MKRKLAIILILSFVFCTLTGCNSKKTDMQIDTSKYSINKLDIATNYNKATVADLTQVKQALDYIKDSKAIYWGTKEELFKLNYPPKMGKKIITLTFKDSFDKDQLIIKYDEDVKNYYIVKNNNLYTFNFNEKMDKFVEEALPKDS